MHNINDYQPNYNRRHIQWRVLITLLSPLSHIGETVGNQSNLREIKVNTLDGESATTFAYSGNSLRNKIIRRIGTAHFLDNLDLQVNPTVHQTLFAGGYIDGGTGSDIGLEENIRRFILPLSVLGAAKPKGAFGGKDAQMIAGRVQIGDAYLLCYESAKLCYDLMPFSVPFKYLRKIEEIAEAERAYIIAMATKSENKEIKYAEYEETKALNIPYLQREMKNYTEWLTWVQRTRRDSLQDSTLQPHLLGEKPPEGQLNLLGTSDKKKPEQKDQRMIMGDWLLQPGSNLISFWSGELTKEEEGFLVNALIQFSQSPYLGGKSNTGCGLVKLEIFAGHSSEYYLAIAPNQCSQSKEATYALDAYQSYTAAYCEYLESAKTSKETEVMLNG